MASTRATPFQLNTKLQLYIDDTSSLTVRLQTRGALTTSTRGGDNAICSILPESLLDRSTNARSQSTHARLAAAP